MKLTDAQRLSVWDTITVYTQTCGGDTGKATVGPDRMAAVVKVEAVAEKLIDDGLAVGVSRVEAMAKRFEERLASHSYDDGEEAKQWRSAITILRWAAQQMTRDDDHRFGGP